MKNFLFILFFLFSTFIIGQKVEWAIPFGSSFDDTAANVTVDSAGNSYLTGFFSGTVDFAPQDSGGELIAQTNIDMFLLKVNADGEFQWVISPDRYVDQGPTAIAITHDKFGNIILEYFMIEGGLDIVRVKKFSSDGALLWTSDMEWFGFVGIGQPAEIDENIVVIDAVCDDEFYARPIAFLNENGNCIKINEINRDKGFISWDEYVENDGSIKMLGEVYGTVSMNWGGDSVMLGEGNFGDDPDWRRSTILADVSTSGNLNSIQILNNGSNDQESGFTNGIFNFRMSYDSKGNLYIFSLSIGVVEYGIGNNTLIMNHGLNGQGVLAKYDPSGDFLWLETWESPANGIMTDMIIDREDNIVLAFAINGNFDADPKAGTFLHEPVIPGTSNLLVVSLNENGEYQWSKDFGVTYARFEIDSANNLLLNGSFADDFDMQTENGSVTFDNQGFTDGYLFKLNTKQDNTSLKESKVGNDMEIYPNPTSGQIYLSNKEFFVLKIYTQTGVLVKHFDLKNTSEKYVKLDLSSLNSGYYMIRAFGNGKVSNGKLLIKK